MHSHFIQKLWNWSVIVSKQNKNQHPMTQTCSHKQNDRCNNLLPCMQERWHQCQKWAAVIDSVTIRRIARVIFGKVVRWTLWQQRKTSTCILAIVDGQYINIFILCIVSLRQHGPQKLHKTHKPTRNTDRHKNTDSQKYTVFHKKRNHVFSTTLTTTLTSPPLKCLP